MLEQDSFFSSSDDVSTLLESALLSNAALKESNDILFKENNWLKEQLAELKRHRFGRKSERYESPEQGVFNEAEMESGKPDLSSEEDDEAGDHDDVDSQIVSY